MVKTRYLRVLMEVFSNKSFSRSIECSPATVKLVENLSDRNVVSFSYTIPRSICSPTGTGRDILTASAALAVLDELSTYAFAITDKNFRPGREWLFVFDIFDEDE